MILTLRLLSLALLSALFYVGFFMHTLVNRVGNHLNDTTIHFVVFFSYIILFYILLPKFRLKWLALVAFFYTSSYVVEVLQRKFFHRSYSLADFEYALLGAILGTFVILFFKLLKVLIKACQR